MSKSDVNTLLALATALLETINEAGSNGAPCGPMYMAFNTRMGMTATQFNMLVDLLVKAGKVRRSGHICYAVT